MRRPVPVRRVKTSPIVEQLDVPRNVAHRSLAGRIYGAVDTLVLESREERFRGGVVETDTRPAERLPKVQLTQDVAVGVGCTV